MSRKQVSLRAKLATEAPVNSGRNYELNRSCKIWLNAGTPEYPTVLARRGSATHGVVGDRAVTIRLVQAISRKGHRDDECRPGS